MKDKPYRRVDTKDYASELGESSWVACTNKKRWPKVKEVVLYGFRLWIVTRVEIRAGVTAKYVAFIEPAFAIFGPIGLKPYYKTAPELMDILAKWGVIRSKEALDTGGMFDTPLGVVFYQGTYVQDVRND